MGAGHAQIGQHAETGLEVIEVPRSACPVCGVAPLRSMASAMKSVASRFSALEAALPGIASNVLAERLRALKTAGVVARMSGSPAGYQLTPAERSSRQ